MSSTGVPKVVLLCGGMGTRMLPCSRRRSGRRAYAGGRGMSPAALLERAEAAFAAGDLADARNGLEQALAAAGDDPALRAQVLNDLAVLERPREAMLSRCCSQRSPTIPATGRRSRTSATPASAPATSSRPRIG